MVNEIQLGKNGSLVGLVHYKTPIFKFTISEGIETVSALGGSKFCKNVLQPSGNVISVSLFISNPQFCSF